MESAGYTVRFFEKASDFVVQVAASASNRQPGDLALIDISLDDVMPSAIDREHQCVQRALALRDSPHPFHGQAVGLWLWGRRAALKLPYAYVSSHHGLFVHQLALDQADPEFGEAGGLAAHGKTGLMVGRGKEGPIGDFVVGICQRWHDAKWIRASGGTT